MLLVPFTRRLRLDFLLPAGNTATHRLYVGGVMPVPANIIDCHFIIAEQEQETARG